MFLAELADEFWLDQVLAAVLHFLHYFTTESDE
jgi:hypothetical protein